MTKSPDFAGKPFFLGMKTDNFMDNLQHLIETNLTNPFLTVDELATMTGNSRRQFYRNVEKATGMTPNRYLREVRLDKAKELLYSGNYQTVKEVALRVGFLKVSYFSKLYEEREGVKASQVLRNIERD